MDMTLTDLETKESIVFPMLPESINVQAGGTFQSYTVMSVGEVKLPLGEELTAFSWEGMLPGEARKNAPYVTEWRNPKEIQSLWSVYRVRKKKLRLTITGTPIDHDVYLDDYSVTYKASYGDYHYSIKFFHAKDLFIQVLTPTSSASAETAAVRPEPPAPKTHTVTGDDTLWGIAQKYYGKGSDYGKIYEANKDALEAEAVKRGKKSSEGGRWIWAGTALKIP